MEEWEKVFRKQLEKEASEGYYNLGIGVHRFVTGKQGYIEYRVAMLKAVEQNIKVVDSKIVLEGTGDRIKRQVPIWEIRKGLTFEDLEDIVNKLNNKKND